MFVVKSTYKLTINNLIDYRSSLNTIGDWRLLRDLLPTRAKVVAKKIFCPQNCICCDSYGENF